MTELALKRIVLVMPRAGAHAYFDAVTAWNNCADDTLEVRGLSKPTTALTCTFNILWASALDIFEAGGCDCFAMQHDDVQPPLGWLNVMHAELLASGADILSAVVPIKDGRALTSTAVDDTGNIWAPRRLTMTEVAELPETFGDADVGGPILLNTGLWIAKLGPWALDLHFTTHNAIRKNPATGKRAVGFIPEDWDFSRRAAEAGAVLMATRKLVIKHHGEAAWHSDVINPDGWDHDRQNAPRKEAANGVPETAGAGHDDPAPAIVSR